MKNLFVVAVMFFLGVFYSCAQSEKELNLEIKSKGVDNIRIRSMDNGDLLIFSAKYKSFRTNATCYVFDQDGNYKGKYEGGKLEVFVDKYNRDNDMSPSGGSSAFTQINESRIFSSKTGKMYLLIQKAHDIRVREISYTGEVTDYDYSSEDFLRPMQMVSWDMKMINDETLRCLFLYNHKESGPVTLVSLDYNLTDHSFSTKKLYYETGLLGFSGHQRPELRMLGTFQNDHQLCIVSAGEKSKFCVLNQDLSMNLSVDGEIQKPESAGSLIGADIIEKEGSLEKYLVLKYEKLVRDGYGPDSDLNSIRQAAFCPLMIEEKGSHAVELGETVYLPFRSERDATDEYRNQLNVVFLKDGRIGVQQDWSIEIYKLDEESKTVITEVAKNFRETLGGTDISPIGFDEEKRAPFLKDGSRGYYYWKNDTSEKAIILFRSGKKFIFRLYSF